MTTPHTPGCQCHACLQTTVGQGYPMDLATQLVAAILERRDELEHYRHLGGDPGSMALLIDYNSAMQRIDLRIMVKPRMEAA